MTNLQLDMIGFGSFKQHLKDSVEVLIGRAIVIDREAASRLSCPVCGADDVPMLQLPLYYFRELGKNQFVHSLFLSETLNFEHYSSSSGRHCGDERAAASTEAWWMGNRDGAYQPRNHTVSRRSINRRSRPQVEIHRPE